ncbi:glycosyltransferase family 39 protein [Magnetovibrio blakemorei]|uniref:Glycosyltransferase RgtA/B/C/D-like domain-containing protein n=1 Tax=Magnetovibrio blakemorei TaxID=28181 RepID=A0A1E5Q9W9_9PROT|nr:glycosyltransferase family 39 protein [Magnetovibrio blakemorei]OEJ68461.1 hypothetical protein BEN30_05870 [Magnetovibrio blakemorei]
MNSLLKTIERPIAIHMMVLALIVVYWSIRMWGFSALGADEAEQVLFAQSFQWGYDVANPPLYTWILLALFSIFGKSIGLTLAFKLIILGAIYIALYQAARISLGPERRLDAALAGLSPLLIFFVSWNSIFVYSHALLNALFVIFTYIAVLKVSKEGKWRWYLALGLLIGLGLLTKYSYAMFVFGLLGASLTISDLRRLIVSRRMLMTLAVASLVLFPHVLWLFDSLEQIKLTTAFKLQITNDVPYLEGVGKGLWNIIRALFAFMSPLWVLLLLIFPVFIKPPKNPQGPSLESVLLGRTLILILGLMAGMVVFGGVTQFRPNYLFLMILFPLWVFTRIPAESIASPRRKVYAALLVSAAILSVAGLSGKAFYDPLRCRKCQYLVPFKEIARELENRGFTGGTLFGSIYPVPLAGNLALYMDNARAVSLKLDRVHRTARPPLQSTPGQCLVVWMAPEMHGPITKNMISELVHNFDADIDPASVPTRLSFPFHRAPNKNVLIDYILLDPGSGRCK